MLAVNRRSVAAVVRKTGRFRRAREEQSISLQYPRSSLLAVVEHRVGQHCTHEALNRWRVIRDVNQLIHGIQQNSRQRRTHRNIAADRTRSRIDRRA
jgi:hypothetical protein